MSEEILREKPSIEIEGVRYRIRRPGLKDCFKLARIIATVQVHAGQNIDDFYSEVPMVDAEGEPVLDSKGNQKIEHKVNGVALLFSFASGIPDAEDDVIDWIASMLIGPDGFELTVEDAKDPDIMPLMEIPPLIEKLIEMPDFQSFFARTVHASEVVRKVLPSKSGKSRALPAGRTNESSEPLTEGLSRSERRRQERQSPTSESVSPQPPIQPSSSEQEEGKPGAPSSESSD